LWALTGCDDDGEAASSSVSAGAAVAGVQPVGFELDEVTVTSAEGENRPITVWVADSAEERGRGLMGVTELGDAEGMLFVFDTGAIHRFFMWRTPMPLDIAFFAADGNYVGEATMEPCLAASSAECVRYAPDEPFVTALEVPAGALDGLGFGPGARLNRS
jgi:uncharacterized protein